MTAQSDNGQNEDGKPDYEVGYGKPPKSGQFQKGQSGNPKGRKRKAKSLRGEVEALLAKKVSIAVGGVQKELPFREVLARALLNKASKGDPRSLQLILNILNQPEQTGPTKSDGDELSPGDKAMLDEVLAHLAEPGDDMPLEEEVGLDPGQPMPEPPDCHLDEQQVQLPSNEEGTPDDDAT